MHLKSAHLQPRLKLRLYGLCFLLGPAVHQSVVSIPTPRKVGMCPPHPEIKRIMQEQIGQYWADYAPYAKGNFTFDRVICGWGRGLTVLDLRLKR